MIKFIMLVGFFIGIVMCGIIFAVLINDAEVEENDERVREWLEEMKKGEVDMKEGSDE